jgi:hypothetical protein
MRPFNLGVIGQELLGPIPGLPEIADATANPHADVSRVCLWRCHPSSMAIGLRSAVSHETPDSLVKGHHEKHSLGSSGLL